MGSWTRRDARIKYSRGFLSEFSATVRKEEWPPLINTDTNLPKVVVKKDEKERVDGRGGEKGWDRKRKKRARPINFAGREKRISVSVGSPVPGDTSQAREREAR